MKFIINKTEKCLVYKAKKLLPKITTQMLDDDICNDLSEYLQPQTIESTN